MLDGKTIDVMEYVSKNECPESLVNYINEQLVRGETLKGLCSPGYNPNDKTSNQSAKNKQDSFSRFIKKHGYEKESNKRNAPFIKVKTKENKIEKEEAVVINEAPKSKRGRKSKKELELIEVNKKILEISEKYPIGYLNRKVLIEKVDESYLKAKREELVSVGPRLSPDAVIAVEWFEAEYSYLPIYLIIDALIKVFGSNIHSIKSYAETSENIEKSIVGGKYKKQKVIKITSSADAELERLKAFFPKFNKSDVINLVLITYKDYLIKMENDENNE